MTTTLKQTILELRGQGRTYPEISILTGASKGTIAYHCSDKYRINRTARIRLRKRGKITELKEKAGGQCVRCCYNKCLEALDFHHKIPSEKVSDISRLAKDSRFALADIEAAKCELICANCHREEHSLQRREKEVCPIKPLYAHKGKKR